ncbi:leucine-rich repeat isoform f-related [Anaeramoeba flamelloides]|uniref:Leucine-rich repeat isoform f-related n=1 Tax=Anaeramoeba flamelloides TaxID=1746091 RepID=A0AAV8AFF1_9EUKA|nr:leucine-rich repeat isoform f-related [Anaeramoeba flamelloides]
MTNQNKVEWTIEKLVQLLEKDLLSVYSNKSKIDNSQPEFVPLLDEHTNIINTIRHTLKNARVESCQEGVFFIIAFLDLSGHQIDKTLLEIVCSFLANDQLLIDSLSLSHNLFCSETAPLMSLLEKNQSIRKLDLSNNDLGPLTLKKFAVLLKKSNQTLEEINFDSTKLGTNSFLLLTGFLISNKTLTRFSALNNFEKIDVNSLLHLYQLIKNNKLMVEFKISDPNNFNEEENNAWKKITTIFEKNKINHTKINQEKRINKLLVIQRKKLKIKKRFEKSQKQSVQNEKLDNFQFDENKVFIKLKTFDQQSDNVKKKEKEKEKEKEIIVEEKKVSTTMNEKKRNEIKLSSDYRDVDNEEDSEEEDSEEEIEGGKTENDENNLESSDDSDTQSLSDNKKNDNSDNNETKEKIFIDEWEKSGFQIDKQDYQKFEKQNKNHIKRLLQTSNNFKKLYSLSFPNKKIN